MGLKPGCNCTGRVECQIVPCDHIYWQVVSHLSRVYLWHQPLVQVFKQLGVVGANANFTLMQERTLSDIATHMVMLAPLWHVMFHFFQISLISFD